MCLFFIIFKVDYSSYLNYKYTTMIELRETKTAVVVIPYSDSKRNDYCRRLIQDTFCDALPDDGMPVEMVVDVVGLNVRPCGELMTIVIYNAKSKSGDGEIVLKHYLIPSVYVEML